LQNCGNKHEKIYKKDREEYVSEMNRDKENKDDGRKKGNKLKTWEIT